MCRWEGRHRHPCRAATESSNLFNLFDADCPSQAAAVLWGVAKVLSGLMAFCLKELQRRTLGPPVVHAIVKGLGVKGSGFDSWRVCGHGLCVWFRLSASSYRVSGAGAERSGRVGPAQHGQVVSGWGPEWCLQCEDASHCNVRGPEKPS